MEQAPLTAWVDHVREISGLNIHISGVEDPEKILLNVALVDQTVDRVLRDTLGPLDLAYDVYDGLVLISSAALLRRKVKLELYDVQDLDDSEEIPDVIRRLVRPKTWSEEKGGTIHVRNGLLIVRATRPVHQEIRGFLARRRGGMAVPIAVGNTEERALERARAFSAAMASLRGAGETWEGRLRARALVDLFEETLRSDEVQALLDD